MGHSNKLDPQTNTEKKIIYKYIFCFDDNMITKEIEKALKRVDKDISNIHEVYIIYCYVATTVLSTINSCFLLLGLVKNSPILLTTWLIIAGIGNWITTLAIVLLIVVSFCLVLLGPSYWMAIVCICLPLL